MQNTICLSGEQAARLFYDERHFQRAQAMPRMLKKTLLGQGGVQGLDGEAHRHRKRMFLQLLDAAAVDELVGCRAELASGDRPMAGTGRSPAAR